MRSILLLLTCTWVAATEVVDLISAPPKNASHRVAGIDSNAECFAIDVTIDPVVAEGGDMQTVASLGIGLPDDASDERTQSTLFVDLREGGERANFVLWHREKNLSSKPPHPKTPGWVDNREYQHPNQMMIRDDAGYRLRLVFWPERHGSRVRLFVDAMDRPKEEHFLEEKITAGIVKLFALRGGAAGQPQRTSRFSDVAFEQLSVDEARRLPSAWETVQNAIDLSYPPMAPVAEAIAEGKTEKAKSLFLNHMRTRSDPPGPALDKIAVTVLHRDWQKIADQVLEGKYGTLGYFTQFSDSWKDSNGDTHHWVISRRNSLQLNWAKDNGHLNRHFHWVSLARAWQENGDSRYAKQFSDEVSDWVSREPFLLGAHPNHRRTQYHGRYHFPLGLHEYQQHRAST